VLWAESEIVYFYAMKKFRTVGGKCGTGHSRRPLPFIKKTDQIAQKYLCERLNLYFC
jgi:hypothetical protein